MKKKYNILAIVGPTACGKTRLAVALALKLDGEIISGDSRQVFRGMNIGTGKDLDEYRTISVDVPYHLIDIAEPPEDYNLYRYITDFSRCFTEITGRGKIPVLCGGSGLYIEAALKGYALPDIPENRAIRNELGGLPKEELSAMLKEESPEIYERTDLSSTRRIIRGIEIARFMKTERTMPVIHESIKCTPLIIGVRFPRNVIIERIDERLEKRLRSGMIEEVDSLLRNGVSAERLFKLGLEYRYCTMYLKNGISYDEMTEKLKTEIHRFAKRQMTWFRGMERRGLAISWIDGDDPAEAMNVINNTGELIPGLF